MSFQSLIESKEKLSQKVLSFEFFPPKNPENLFKTKQQIKELAKFSPDFMTCTYGAGGGTKETTLEIVSYMANELSQNAVAHLTCVGHSKDDLREILRDLKAANVSHILALRGDPPKGESKFKAHPEGLSCARDLVKFIKEEQGDFSLAVAGYPEMHQEAKSKEADISYLKEKVDSGSELIITQLFFDADMYLNFQTSCQKAGIKAKILPGIMPISSVKQVRRFTEMCGASIPETLSEKLKELEGSSSEEVKTFGAKYAAELSKELLDRGAPGVHLYTLNDAKQVSEIAGMLGF